MAYLLQLRMEGPIGFFSSPHLCKIEERIRIDGRPVDGWVLDDALRHVRRVCESDPDLRLSFYELTFLLAMTVFKQLGVVRAVVETGLGGRLDPTCLVDADACLVTMIGMDHSEVLGENLSDIAMEKAAIRRPGRPFLALLPETMEVQQAIRDGAGWDDGCRWVEVGHLGPILHERADPPQPRGPHQDASFLTTAAHLADAVLSELDLQPTALHLKALSTNFRWIPSDHELLHPSGLVRLTLSGAHNVDGLRATTRLRHLRNPGSEGHIDVLLFGCTEKSDLDAFLHELQRFLSIHRPGVLMLTEPRSGRSPPVTTEDLHRRIITSEDGPQILIEREPLHAFGAAMSIATRLIEERSVTQPTHGRPLDIGILGSLYLIGDLLPSIATRFEVDLDELLSLGH